MKFLRRTAAAFLVLIFIATLFAGILAPAPYAKQFRESPNALPSRIHLLGTDELGRDLFSRLLYGSRVSLLLAPAASMLATIIAALVGGLAGYVGGWLERVALASNRPDLQAPERVFFVSGRLTPLAQKELSKRGWKLFESFTRAAEK